LAGERTSLAQNHFHVLELCFGKRGKLLKKEKKQADSKTAILILEK